MSEILDSVSPFNDKNEGYGAMGPNEWSVAVNKIKIDPLSVLDVGRHLSMKVPLTNFPSNLHKLTEAGLLCLNHAVAKRLELAATCPSSNPPDQYRHAAVLNKIILSQEHFIDKMAPGLLDQMKTIFESAHVEQLHIADKIGFDVINRLDVRNELLTNCGGACSDLFNQDTSSGCVIATVCLDDVRVSALRKLRDDAIGSDPIARDFFHVFWSRYYEWAPGVARIASQDPAVAKHIRWSFLDPWLAWLEFATSVGQRNIEEISEDERLSIMRRLCSRLELWLAELPTTIEGKCPPDASQVFEAFERLRMSARKVFVS